MGGRLHVENMQRTQIPPGSTPERIWVEKAATLRYRFGQQRPNSGPIRIFRMKFLWFPAAALLLGHCAQAAPLALGNNEQLVYRVSWAFIPAVGRITVAAQAVTAAGRQPLLRVTTETETRGLGYLILPFDARAQSDYDASTGRLVHFSETSATRSKDAAHTMDFDYPHLQALYAEAGSGKPVRRLPLPPGDPSDLIDCLLSTRNWSLVPGQTHDALVFFEDDFYQLTVHALRYEDIMTPLGNFRTLVLEPRMEKTPPLGMFKRGSTVKVWIAQSAPHLPVRFQVQFNFGSGVATLTDYRPPTPPVPARPAPR
jgi:hypothetical protein